MKPTQGLHIFGDHSNVTSLSRAWRRNLLSPDNPEELRARDFRRKKNPLRKGVVERVPHTGASNPNYSSGMCLASLLYPKNFPKIIATSKTGTYSKRIRLTRESQEAIENFYAKVNEIFATKYNAYKIKYSENAEKLSIKIFDETGIRVNPNMMNVGINKKGEFVFFEVSEIDTGKVSQAINKILGGLRKKQALMLLEHLKTRANMQGIARIHDSF